MLESVLIMEVSKMESLEKMLDDVFGKKSAVQLPQNVKKVLTEWMPWIALVLGLLQLWAAWAFWQLGHYTNQLVDYANSFYQAVGAKPVVQHLGVFYWVSLVVLVADAALLLFAFPGLRAKSKVKGWNLLFYSMLLNVIYGIVRLFTDVGSGFGSLFGAVIGTAIGLFFLFQVRELYSSKKTANAAKAANPAEKK